MEHCGKSDAERITCFMSPMFDSDKALPNPLRAQDLKTMLGPSKEFCSWDSTANLKDSLSGWPYLFSRPLTDTYEPNLRVQTTRP